MNHEFNSTASVLLDVAAAMQRYMGFIFSGLTARINSLACGVSMALVLFAAPAEAVTITGMDLNGGSGGAAWVSNGQIWSVNNPGLYVLGVSATANGALVNQGASGTTLSVPFGRNYWLYADPTSLGTTVNLVVYTVELGTLNGIFNISGAAGTESVWSLVGGSPLLQLGWAAGTADKVGTFRTLSPNGVNDFYLHLQAGTAVPAPSTLPLFAAGIAIMAGFGFYRRKQMAD